MLGMGVDAKRQYLFSLVNCRGWCCDIVELFPVRGFPGLPEAWHTDDWHRDIGVSPHNCNTLCMPYLPSCSGFLSHLPPFTQNPCPFLRVDAIITY